MAVRKDRPGRHRLRQVVIMAAFATFLLSSAAPADAASRPLTLNFDQAASLARGSRVTDMSGRGNHGTVLAQFGGVIVPTAGSADFPGPCSREPCPNAIIQVSSSSTLNPGAAPFEWGADVRLRADERTAGANVLQKGRFGAAGGQWKLQVDSARPSCILSGARSGTSHQRTVASSTSIADDGWHWVACRRTSTGLSLLIDGVVRASASMPVVTLSSSAAVTIGGKDVSSYDNDQFQGRLDNVFMQLL